MMIRHEIDNSKCPSFKSKKSINYCQVLFDILKDDDKLLNTVNESIKKISSLPYDIDSSDISKSKEFVTDCLKLYNT